MEERRQGSSGSLIPSHCICIPLQSHPIVSHPTAAPLSPIAFHPIASPCYPTAFGPHLTTSSPHRIPSHCIFIPPHPHRHHTASSFHPMLTSIPSPLLGHGCPPAPQPLGAVPCATSGSPLFPCLSFSLHCPQYLAKLCQTQLSWTRPGPKHARGLLDSEKLDCSVPNSAELDQTVRNSAKLHWIVPNCDKIH